MRADRLLSTPRVTDRDEIFPAFDQLAGQLRPHILRHGYTRGGKDWNYPDTFSPYNRLYFFLNGKARVGHAGRFTRLVPGRVYLLPLHERYHLVADGPFEKFFIHFRMELWPGRDLFSEAPKILPLSLPAPDSKKWIALARNGSASDFLLFQARLSEIFGMFLKEFPRSRGQGLGRELLLARKYRSVFEAAETLPFSEISVSRLARQMETSLPALSRAFRRDAGMTLTSFIRMRLVRRAQDELLLTRKKVHEIARELGFEDEHYFSRFFKKEADYSPQQYRSENRLE